MYPHAETLLLLTHDDHRTRREEAEVARLFARVRRARRAHRRSPGRDAAGHPAAGTLAACAATAGPAR